MIRGVIFDLDNCLSPADEPGRQLLEPTFTAIRAENRGRLSDAQLRNAFDDCWIHALDVVAKKHGFSSEMLEAGRRVLSEARVTTPMRGYGDLEQLAELNVDLFLVTSGFRGLQESKVDALGIRSHFKEIHVDALDADDRTSKQQLFEDIMRRRHLAASEVLVVGDNIDSELAAGIRLGIRTVQTLRPGIRKSDLPTHHVDSLSALRQLLASL